ncbi:MAG TPA: PKD domain-containing protein, partial [Thermoanaerobaculia bacterium]|nr:PKD domain-containing protein [Thermoanaerobaculia bacterium]
MNKFRVYGLTCVLMMLASETVRATTIVLPTDEQLIAKSPVIVEGTVVSSAPVDRDGSIWTETVIAVARNHKGRTAQTITVQEIGGVIDERITKVFGTPEFAQGERVLLFLERTSRGVYRTVDLFVGKFEQGKMENGRRLWLRHDAAADATLLDGQFRPIAARNVQRDAEGFETFVAERVAGLEGAKNYGVENPVLARNTVEAGGSRIEANFTLIAEPNKYRWFAFDNGGSATWYSSGSQPGYSSGGVNELKIAIAPWNNYAGAKITYEYAGTRSGSMGGLKSPNGVNEVLFNDPLGEITGSWNPSTGGVVGTGGFNGVAAARPWTATFTADPSHAAGTYQYYNIVEGNLTIQDNVTPGAGISSTELAEIIAHEFGHTLGFGHSTDPSALMYYSVTGIGPSLRNDDQLAARWLYPNDNVAPGPSVPATPSGLDAYANGSSIQVNWNDNASNETGYRVFVGTNSHAFAANTSAATLSGLSAGNYDVSVAAFNATGESTRSNVVTVTILPTAPVASFTISAESGSVGKPLTFTSTTSGTVASLRWDFGDGQQMTGATVVPHTYGSAGQYTVVLTATGTAGQVSRAQKMVVIHNALTAAFAATPNAPTTNDVVTFTDQSTGGAASWFWSFGDGSSSSEQNPSKHFPVAGDYNVTLTVGRNAESSSITRIIKVSTSSVPVTPGVVALFDMSTQIASAGAPVSFSDRSLGAPTQWSWSFGDGGTSSAQNPVHAYATAGTYMVTLTAGNGGTSSMSTKQLTVSNTPAYRTMVSALAQAPGLGGTSWRTELSLFNAGAQGANITFTYLPSAGGSAATRTLFLAPKQAKTYANTLLDLFGMSSGVGGLTIDASSAGGNADLRITSRTFTSGANGTYGQAVPDVRPEALARTLYVTGVVANAAYRTNIGLVNGDASSVSATLTLLNHIGTTLGTKNVTLAARTFEQHSLLSLFPIIEGGSFDALTVRVAAASENALSAYGSVIDNRSQDPIYIQAIAPPSGNSMVVPVVGRAPGANGTFWRSDVTFFNPSSTSTRLTLHYNGDTETLNVGANDTEVLKDVLSFFRKTSGSGVLTISWSAAVAPVVTSRTYTSVESGGTYGQSIDPVAAFVPQMFVPGLRHDDSYRSNVGFVNGGTESETITVRLLSLFGTEIGRTTVTLAPNAQVQHGV